MAIGSAADVSFILESGRAGTLLESLSGREALAALAPEEALVSYASLKTDAVALVVIRESARVLPLGDLSESVGAGTVHADDP